jgi:serine/threonine protein phosphatase PrpC/ribosomal protein L40E
MKCPTCGAAVLLDTDRYCSQCGNELTARSPTPRADAGVEQDSAHEPGSAVGETPASSQPAGLRPAPGPVPPAEMRAVATVVCPMCEFENRPTARFCLKCGHPFVEAAPPLPQDEPHLALAGVPVDSEPAVAPEVICSSCGAENRLEARFCQGCGRTLAIPSMPEPEPAAGEELATPASEREREPMAAEEMAAAAAADGPRPGLAPADPLSFGAPAYSFEEPEAAAGEPAPMLPRAPVSAPGALEQRVESAQPSSFPLDEPAPAGELPGPSPEAAADVTPCPPEPPSPLEVGTQIGGQYLVLGILSPVDEGTNLYSVVDLKRCWSCQQPVTDPTQPFCGECGAEVALPPKEQQIHLAETLAPGGGNGFHEGAVVENGRIYVLVPQGEVAAAEQPFPHGVRLAVGQASDTGQIRELDEDSVFVLALTGLHETQAKLTVGLFIVADGIGGHDGGEWASRLATQVIASELLRNVIAPVMSGDVLLPLLEEAVCDHLRRAVEAANQKIFDVRTHRDSDMGTTVTLALVLDNWAYVANVGDSRTYLWGGGGLDQITTDHSLVASLIASGMAKPEEVYTHPQRSAIYRSLGDKRTVVVDTFSRQLAPGNTLLLCCDGVWEMIRNEGIEDLLLQGLLPQATCDEAVRRANLAGGEDNISIVVVRAENNG